MNGAFPVEEVCLSIRLNCQSEKLLLSVVIGFNDQGPDRSTFNRNQGNDYNDNNRQDNRGGFSGYRGRRDPPSGDSERRYDDNYRRDNQSRGNHSLIQIVLKIEFLGFHFR